MAEKYSWIIRDDLFYKLEPDTKGKGKICEIRLGFPGSRIFAVSNEETFKPPRIKPSAIWTSSFKNVEKK